MEEDLLKVKKGRIYTRTKNIPDYTRMAISAYRERNLEKIRQQQREYYHRNKTLKKREDKKSTPNSVSKKGEKLDIKMRSTQESQIES